MSNYKPQEFAEMIGVSVKTLQRWDREGILISQRTPTDRRYYTHKQYVDYMGIVQQNKGKTIIYARVSTSNQKYDLKNQVEFLKQYANAKGIIIDEVFDSVILSDEGISFLNYLLYGSELVMDNDKIEEIAIELRSLFPNGKKHGTNQYWKDNLPNIKNNLIKFFKLYGEFDKETIIKATKKYINSFENDNTLMRTSKYFIFKDGNSELLTVIENLEENENLEDLWKMLV